MKNIPIKAIYTLKSVHYFPERKRLIDRSRSAAVTPGGALALAVDARVGVEAVPVLGVAGLLSVGVALGEASGSVGLAALGVNGVALLVLGPAGVVAAGVAVRTRVRRALAAVLVVVQLEGVAPVPVGLDVVARHDGQRDAADRVAGTVAVLAVGWLDADTGRRGDGAARGRVALSRGLSS